MFPPAPCSRLEISQKALCEIFFVYKALLLNDCVDGPQAFDIINMWCHKGDTGCNYKHFAISVL